MNPPKENVCRYCYSALDLLSAIQTAGAAELRRFYCRDHLATEIQGRSRQMVFQFGPQLLALQPGDGDSTESQLLATDLQRSVMHVSQPAGPLHHAYTPYGHRRPQSGLDSLLGFAGEAVDRVTGHYLLGNGHRAFNPVLMRFNSPDSLSPFGRGGLNPYAYCLGDPVNFSDPTGRFGAAIAKLLTSLFGVGGARIGLSASVPFKPARDALLWGAAGQLPLKHTFGAASSVIAGHATMVSAIAGVASAVAGITGDTEAAEALGFIALGLAALTVTARLGSHWAARDPRTVPSLKDFVKNEGRVAPIPSAPPLTPDPFAGATAPFPTASPTDVPRFIFPGNNRALGFLNEQIDRQAWVARQPNFRRHSGVETTARHIRRPSL